MRVSPGCGAMKLLPLPDATRRSTSSVLESASPSREEDTRRRTVPVAFIAGVGRSGTTLLDRLLGSTPKLHSGGELGAVWNHGLVEDRLCSCGARFSCCPFWQAVGTNSFSSLRADEIDTVVRYTHSVFRTQKMWRILFGRSRRSLVNSAPSAFFETTERLYQRVLDVSARQVVVDSSKLPMYLVLLEHIPSVDLHVVHLVRDPRAVAHSWLRPLVSDPDGRTSMPRFGAAKSAVLWLITNAAVEWIAWWLEVPYVRVRYEDLVKDPAWIVRQLRSEILRATEYGDQEVRNTNNEDIDLDIVHSISGNPMRFRQGRMSIVEDVEWQTGPRSRKAIVAAITFPLRWRYGYRGSPGFSQGRPVSVRPDAPPGRSR